MNPNSFQMHLFIYFILLIGYKFISLPLANQIEARGKFDSFLKH